MILIQFIWHNALAFLTVLSLIIFIHELGHFLVARYYGIKVKTFSLGFGPELIGFTGKTSQTRYRFSLLPLGGYVSMYGEELNRKENDPQTSFSARKPHARAMVIAAGPIANFILGFLLMCLFFLLQGVNTDRLYGINIGNIVAHSPAQNAGFQVGDRITHINDKKIRSFPDLVNIVRNSQGNNLTFTLLRPEAPPLTLTLTPGIKGLEENNDNHQSYYIGIGASQQQLVSVNLWQATVLSVDNIFWFTRETFQALGEIINGKRGTEDLGGPIRIAMVTQEFAKHGIINLIFFTSILSINLGLINLFPIPVLDGGHLVFIFYEMLARKPVSLKIKEKMMQFGFAIIIALMLFVTVNDLLYL